MSGSMIALRARRAVTAFWPSPRQDDPSSSSRSTRPSTEEAARLVLVDLPALEGPITGIIIAGRCLVLPSSQSRSTQPPWRAAKYPTIARRTPVHYKGQRSSGAILLDPCEA